MKHWNIEPKNFLSSPNKWSPSIGGLNVSPSTQGLATVENKVYLELFNVLFV